MHITARLLCIFSDIAALHSGLGASVVLRWCDSTSHSFFPGPRALSLGRALSLPRSLACIYSRHPAGFLSFFLSKRGAIPGYHTLIAKELAATSGKGNGSAATLDDVINLYSYAGVDSHDVFEGHLPAVCPFSMVDKIIFPKHDHDRLTSAESSLLKSWFPRKGQIVVTDSEEDPANAAQDGELQTELLELSREHALEPETSPMPSGFSFGVSSDQGKEMQACYLPTKASFGGGNKVFVNMKVHVERGSGFYIVLHNSRKASAKYTVAVYVEPPKNHTNKGSLYIANNQQITLHAHVERSPMPIKGGVRVGIGHLVSEPNFDICCDTSTAIGYELEINPKEKTVSIQHYGVSYAYVNQFQDWVSSRICSRTLIGYSEPPAPLVRSTPSVFSRGGSLLLLFMLTAALMMTSSHSEGTTIVVSWRKELSD